MSDTIIGVDMGSPNGDSAFVTEVTVDESGNKLFGKSYTPEEFHNQLKEYFNKEEVLEYQYMIEKMDRLVIHYRSQSETLQSLIKAIIEKLSIYPPGHHGLTNHIEETKKFCEGVLEAVTKDQGSIG